MSILHFHRPAFKKRLMAGIVPDWLKAHKRCRYITQAVLSFPFWVDRAELKQLVAERDKQTALTGVPHQLDHDIPLLHPCVCGLTVPWNIRVLTRQENLKKGGLWSSVECTQESFNL
jgi:hypothetical protein